MAEIKTILNICGAASYGERSGRSFPSRIGIQWIILKLSLSFLPLCMSMYVARPSTPMLGKRNKFSLSRSGKAVGQTKSNYQPFVTNTNRYHSGALWIRDSDQFITVTWNRFRWEKGKGRGERWLGESIVSLDLFTILRLNTFESWDMLRLTEHNWFMWTRNRLEIRKN